MSLKNKMKKVTKAAVPAEDEEARKAAEEEEEEASAKAAEEEEEDEDAKRKAAEDDDESGDDEEDEDGEEEPAKASASSRPRKSAGKKSRTDAAFDLIKSADAKGREAMAAELAKDVAAGRALTPERATAILKAAPKGSALSAAMADRDINPGSDNGDGAKASAVTAGWDTAFAKRPGQRTDAH